MAHEPRGLTAALILIVPSYAIWALGAMAWAFSGFGLSDTLVCAVPLVFVAVTAWGLWCLRRWAYWIGIVLACLGSAFVLPKYFNVSYWKDVIPQLRLHDILSSFAPAALLVIWLIHFLRPSIRAQFHRKS